MRRCGRNLLRKGVIFDSGYAPSSMSFRTALLRASRTECVLFWLLNYFKRFDILPHLKEGDS